MTTFFSNQDEKLSADILELIDSIHNFAYPKLAPKFKTLGELYQTLSVEVVDDAGKSSPKKYVARITIGDLRRHIAKLQEENKRIQVQNERLLAQMRRTDDFKMRNALESQMKSLHRIEPLQAILNNNRYKTDDTLIEVPNKVNRLGYYTRRNGKCLIVIERVYDKYAFATTYIHELMHAYYDADLNKPMNNAEYAEEPLAEFGMLRFVCEYVKANPAERQLLTDAIADVTKKQNCLSLAHYGFGAYLFKRYDYIEWEKLMRDAQSGIVNASSPYTDLQQALQGVYPDIKQLPKVAGLLYNVLLTANGQPQAALPAKASLQQSSLLSPTMQNTVKKTVQTAQPVKPEEIKSQLQTAYDLRDKIKSKYGKVLPEQDAEIQELERKFLEDCLTPELIRCAKELLCGVRFDVQVDVLRVEELEEETTSVNEPNPPAYSAPSRVVKSPSKKILVTFANGKSFCESNSIKTLIAVLEYIGFAQVAQLNIQRGGYNLVGKTMRPQVLGRTWQHECKGWYIYSNTSNKAKIEDLKKIAKELNIQMDITEF